MKNKFTSISHNVWFNYAGTLLIFIIVPLLTFFLTRILDIEHYGIYIILSATISIVTVLLDMGLVQYFISHLAGKSKEVQMKYLMKFLVYVSTIIISITAILLLIPKIFNTILNLLRINSYATEFKIAIAIMFLTVLTRIIMGYLVANKKFLKMNILSVTSQTLWALIAFAYYYFTGHISILNIITIWLIGTILTLTSGFGMIWSDTLFFLKKNKFKKATITKTISNLFPESYILYASLPLILLTANSWIIELADRYLINYFIGKEAVAQYALGYALLGFVIVFSMVVLQTLIPYITSAFNTKNNYSLYVNMAIKYTLILTIPACTGFLILRYEIVTMISGDKYVNAAKIIPYMILFPLLFVLNHLFTQLIILYNENKTLTWTYFIGAIFNIILNIFLIPTMGIAGAAVATTLSYGAVCLAMYFKIRKNIMINYSFIQIHKIVFASLIMAIAIYFIQPQHFITKLFTVILGGVAYGISILILRLFDQKEINIILKILPSKVREIIKKILPI